MPNKFITNLDLARQAEIFSGETAVFKGGMQLGIPFSGFPTGVDTSTISSLGVVDVQFAAFSGNTGTTVFNVTDPASPYYSVSATTLSTSPYTVIDEDTIVETDTGTTYSTIMTFTAISGATGTPLSLSFSPPIIQELYNKGVYSGLFNNLGVATIGTLYSDESFYNVGSTFSGANLSMEIVEYGSHGSTPSWVTGTTSGTVIEYSAMTQYWTDPTIITYTSGLTLPITPESAETQTSDYIWTLTDSTVIDENLVGIKYTGYSITYSFNNLSVDPTSPSVTGATGTTSADTYYFGTVVATFENFSAGTLDYKGSTNWLTIDGRATVEERFTTDRMTILNPDTGSSVSTLGIDVDGKVVTYTPTITSEVTGLTFDNVSYDLSLGLDNGTSFTDNLGILASDIKVTGGTYDNATGEMTFVNNSGGSFVISGLTTGSTLQEVLDVGSTYTGSDAISMITTSTIVDRGDTSYTAFGGSSASSGRGSSYLTPTDARFRLETGIGVYSELNLTSASMLITDLVNSKGIEYGADYSSNFTNRSLVDKEYVVNSISGFVETTLFNTYTGNTETVLNSKLNISDFNTYSGNVQTQLDGKTNNTEFTSHTGDTTIHYTKGSINLSDLGSTAHTHTLSEITDFNSYSGSVQTQIDGKVETTLFNTYTGNTQTTLNTKIETASNIGSGEGIFSGKSGTDLQFKSLTSTGGTVTISSTGSTVNLESASGSLWTDDGSGQISYSDTGAAVQVYETGWPNTYEAAVTVRRGFMMVGEGHNVGHPTTPTTVGRSVLFGGDNNIGTVGNTEWSFIAGQNNTIEEGFYNIILGRGNTIKNTSDDAITIGRSNEITGSDAIAIGNTNTLSSSNAIAIGNALTAGYSSVKQILVGDNIDIAAPWANKGFYVGFGVNVVARPTFGLTRSTGLSDSEPLNLCMGSTSAVRNDSGGAVTNAGSGVFWQFKGDTIPTANPADGVAHYTADRAATKAGYEIKVEDGTKHFFGDFSVIGGGNADANANKTLTIRGTGIGSGTSSLVTEDSGGNTTFEVKDDGTVVIPTVGGTTPVTNLGVDASGNVVSGTTGGGGGSVWTASTNTATYDGNSSLETNIKLVNSSTGTGVNDGLLIGISSSNTYLINKESGSIDFRTRVASTDIDRLKILNDGTVRVIKDSGGLVISSVSTTTPASIGVYGTAGNAHFSSPTYGYTTNDGMFVGIGTGVDAHGYAWVKENLPFIIKTNNTEKLRVKGDGNVGIGFPDFNDGTAITAKLHVRGSGTTSSGSSFIVESNDGTDSFEIKDDGTIVISNVGSTTPVTNLAVDASGNVVSGTTSGGGGLNYISAGAVATNLETTSNWDINGVYTGATATGSQGDCHVDSNYWFTCVATNTWIRLIRG